MEKLLASFERQFNFNNSVSDLELAETQEKLNVTFPSELTGLLNKTNGITDDYGFNIVWSAKKILDQNLSFRNDEEFKELYMPFDNLLFFGEEANGDLYAFIVLEDKINRSDIFIWEHETDSRNWFASNLEKYLEKRLNEIS